MPGTDGKGVMHAEVRFGDSIIMMGEENSQEACKSAETIGGSPVRFYIYVGERRCGWVFAKDNDINPAKEAHMHALSITFEDNDHILQKWTMFEQGKAKQVVTFNLTRVR